jgi:hypothetical protein
VGNEIQIGSEALKILSPELFEVFGEEVEKGTVKAYYKDYVVFFRKAYISG